MDMQWVKEYNEYSYVLLSYDTYSKYLTGFPLLNRQPPAIEAGLEALLKGPLPIYTIYWDKVVCCSSYPLTSDPIKEGSFLSKRIQSWLKEHKIHNYTTKVSLIYT